MASEQHYIRLANSLPFKLRSFFAKYPPLLKTPSDSKPAATCTKPFNPFASGIYSLRRQADLFKLARKHGVEGFLPFTVKGTEERLRRRIENGLRVRGTGIGQKVKGKGWER